jgi:aminoglycoside 2'-N-acetyltransferase I
MAISTASTADLGARELAEVRRLLDEAFEGDLTDEDWAHALGGVHAVARDAGLIVGHASVVARTLWVAGTPTRCGYVEAVAVGADWRGEGIGARLMDPIEDVIRERFAIGGLSATDEALGFYRRRGWREWEGPTFVEAPEGRRRTPDDDGSVMVLPVAEDLDVAGEIACDWRDGDVW